jgi:hypothetical protein
MHLGGREPGQHESYHLIADLTEVAVYTTPDACLEVTHGHGMNRERIEFGACVGQTAVGEARNQDVDEHLSVPGIGGLQCRGDARRAGDVR